MGASLTDAPPDENHERDGAWDLLLVPERFRILHLLLKSVVYDGATGELELGFYSLGIISLAAEAAMIGQPDAEAA